MINCETLAYTLNPCVYLAHLLECSHLLLMKKKFG